MSKILEYLLDRQEAMIETLGQLVMLESPSTDPAAVNSVGNYLAQAFGALDARVERIPQTVFGDHLRVSWGKGDRQLLLLGHMDTVWPVGETAERPFRATQEAASGILVGTGPGAFDMKGGLAIGLFAVSALRDLELIPAQRLVFLFNSDEEVGSITSRLPWCWNLRARTHSSCGARAWAALSWRSREWPPIRGLPTSGASAPCRKWPTKSCAWRP
jgi:glutamate carboxypeptidase